MDTSTDVKPLVGSLPANIGVSPSPSVKEENVSVNLSNSFAVPAPPTPLSTQNRVEPCETQNTGKLAIEPEGSQNQGNLGVQPDETQNQGNLGVESDPTSPKKKRRRKKKKVQSAEIPVQQETLESVTSAHMRIETPSSSTVHKVTDISEKVVSAVITPVLKNDAKTTLSTTTVETDPKNYVNDSAPLARNSENDKTRDLENSSALLARISENDSLPLVINSESDTILQEQKHENHDDKIKSPFKSYEKKTTKSPFKSQKSKPVSPSKNENIIAAFDDDIGDATNQKNKINVQPLKNKNENTIPTLNILDRKKRRSSNGATPVVAATNSKGEVIPPKTDKVKKYSLRSTGDDESHEGNETVTCRDVKDVSNPTDQQVKLWKHISTHNTYIGYITFFNFFLRPC